MDVTEILRFALDDNDDLTTRLYPKNGSQSRQHRNGNLQNFPPNSIILIFHRSCFYFTTDYTDFHGLKYYSIRMVYLKICVNLCNPW